MKKILKLYKSNESSVIGESIEPRGIHHTVSYAESFQNSWDHIHSEIQRLSTPAELYR